MTKNPSLNKTIKPGIQMISKGRYRCRVQRNNKKYEVYLPSLKKATTWVRNTRLGIKTNLS